MAHPLCGEALEAAVRLTAIRFFPELIRTIAATLPPARDCRIVPEPGAALRTDAGLDNTLRLGHRLSVALAPPFPFRFLYCPDFL
jgi:hypothetical protein